MVIVFLQEITNRARYIFEYLFEEVLKVPVVLSSDLHAFKNSTHPKINYSLLPLDCPLKMYPHPILFQRTIIHQDLEPVPFEDELFFFGSSEDSFLPFDPFAASFYLVSRYEEYLMREFDEHCRYPSHHSILSCNHLLHKPIVNQWAQLIARKIQGRYPEFEYRKPQFGFLSTIDIDNAWAYKNKSVWRTAGALAKGFLKGNGQQNIERLLVLRGRKADPYDTYDFIKELYKDENKLLQFFVLLGKTSKYDRNVSPKNKQLRQLVAELSDHYEVGIHPSYRSTKNPKEMDMEIGNLQDISNKKVIASRQHFLRLVLPQTYRNLIKAGIKNDYTLGYASQVGFRAGTANPFWFYDLKKETTTKLRVYPFHMMDVALKNSLELTPEDAWGAIEKLMLEVRKYGGTFISLWHNESLGDQGEWAGWRQVFVKMTALGIKYKNESN
jgi:hypothetical protein